MNIYEVLIQSMVKHKDKIAIDFEGDIWTYGRLISTVGRTALFLKKMGIKKGDRVAIQLPKGMEFICLHLAVQSLGAVTLPLNPAYSQEEIKYFLSDSEAVLYITNANKFYSVNKAIDELENLKIFLVDDGADGFGPLWYELEKIDDYSICNHPTSGDDISTICYTSGTTGKPKGAMISHRNLITNMLALNKIWLWSHNDILLHVLPLFHVHGLFVALHGALYAGATIIMHKRFDATKSWKTIERFRCTIFMGVPTIYYRLLKGWYDANADISSMRVFISGSAPLPKSLFEDFEEITGHRILERYGMTETQMITSNPYEPDRRIPGSVGFPLPGVSLRVVDSYGRDAAPPDVGEVWVKGENVFLGYWKNPEKTGESFNNGWFKTGDLGYLDPDDNYRLYLVGRMKELIITGGYNVYPREVENILEEHDMVSEAAVVGLSDPDYGERVVAAVVLNKEFKGGSEGRALIEYCKTRLASYKCPKEIFILDFLPKNAMGKVEKSILKKKLQHMASMMHQKEVL